MKNFIKKVLGRDYLFQIIDRLDELSHDVEELQKKTSETAHFASTAKNGAAVSLSDNIILTKIYTGQLMYVDARDASESPHLIMSGVWEEQVTKVFQGLIDSGDTVIDVGSTYGYFGVVAGSVLEQNDGARLFMIDANPVYSDYMQKNLTVNGLVDFGVASNVALAGKKGKLELTVLKDDWASSTFQTEKEFKKHRTAPYEIDRKIKVEAMTLDQYAEQHNIEMVDMIKLDIEGLEEASYPGMKRIIERSPKIKMLFEFTPESYKDPAGLFKQITDDFMYVYCMPEGRSPARVVNYDELQSVANDEWFMLLMSKQDISDRIALD